VFQGVGGLNSAGGKAFIVRPGTFVCNSGIAMGHGVAAGIRPEIKSRLPMEVLTSKVKNGIMILTIKENRGNALLSFIK